MKKNIYALYKGDTFLDLGNIKELAEKFKVKEETLYWYATSTYKKRIKDKENCIIVIKIND